MKEKTIAIAGNPNTGKTTIFNALTGLRQKTGNWPGVTVEKKEGYYFYKDTKFNVVDLPGTYTLTEESEDQKIAIDFLTKEKVDAVVITVDASNIERGLYLFSLISEIHPNIIIDLNMVDIAEKEGIKYDKEKLENYFKVPFVETIGNKNIGIEKLKELIYEKCEEKKEEIFHLNYGPEIEEIVEKIIKILGEISIPYPLRFVAIRLIEKQEFLTENFIEEEKKREIEKLIQELKDRIKDPEKYMIEKRYGIIHGIVKDCVVSLKREEKRIEITNKIDKILIHNFWGPAIFLFIMFFIFQLIFKLGSPFGRFINLIIGKTGDAIYNFLISLNSPLWVGSLFKDGIISGIGSVIVFVPNIFIFFLLFSILEDIGYISRAAFITDRLMHKLGLHGKSAIPLILGFGCNVPAIMGTRIFESKKDKILTSLMIPFMSCSARLPVYLLFTGIFFQKNQGIIIFSLYLMGIIFGILTAKIFRFLFFKEELTHLIMELPPYHLPYWKNIFTEAWERTKLFLKKAGTVIFLGVLIVWFLNYFPDPSNFGRETSFIGKLGKILAPLLKPAGFGFWQASVALIFGIYAKELVVGTFGTLFGETNLNSVLPLYFTPVSAYSFMLMSLFYIPCIATVVIIKKEIGIKWALVSIFWSIFVGWTVATIFYQIFSISGGG